MDPQVADKRNDEPDLKRQKLDLDDEDNNDEDDAFSYTTSEDSLGYTSEDARLFDEEHERSGDYDFDASRVGKLVVFYPVDFEDNNYAIDKEHETNRDTVERLSKLALEKYNDDERKDFEFVRAVKSNWSVGGGRIFSITFEAKDASSCDPLTFHAKVRDLAWGSTVFHVKPKST